MTKPTTVVEYVAQFPGSVQGRLSEIRSLCRAAAPTEEEHLKWGHPAYVHTNGVILVMFSGHKAHASLAVTPSTHCRVGGGATGVPATCLAILRQGPTQVASSAVIAGS